MWHKHGSARHETRKHFGTFHRLGAAGIIPAKVNAKVMGGGAISASCLNAPPALSEPLPLLTLAL